MSKIEKIKPKFDQEAFMSELVQQYRQDFKENGGGFLLKHARDNCFRVGNISDDEKIDINAGYISSALKVLICQNKSLWRAMPSMETVKTILQKKYDTSGFEINFIASFKNVERFLKNGGKSKSFSLVFHGTNSRNNSSIIANGLVVGGTKGVPIANGKAYGTGIYCSPSLDTTGCYANGSMFICLIRNVGISRSGTIFVVPNDNDILPIYLHSFGYSDGGTTNWAYLNRMQWMVNSQKRKKGK